MTAVTASPTASPFRSKVLGTARLHLVNLRTGLVVPLSILGVILVANVTLFTLILGSIGPVDRADAQQGLQYSGASFYFVVYMVVFGVQAVSVTFPFALSWGATRRAFALGTVIAIGLRALAFGALFTVLSLIESGTNGWGSGGRMFTAVYFPVGEWYWRLIGFTAMFLVVMIAGAAVATVWVRWRGTGMLVLWLSLGLIAVVAVAAVTLGHGWPAVGTAVEGLFSLGAAMLWTLTLIPSVVLAVLGWLVLRRAAPRS